MHLIYSWWTNWTGVQPCRKAATYTGQHKKKKQRRNEDRHSCLEWDSTPRILVSERAKTFHALDCTATVTAESFPSNGCLCWLHRSCLEQICHNINYNVHGLISSVHLPDITIVVATTTLTCSSNPIIVTGC
jgi:hypothetical protein